MRRKVSSDRGIPQTFMNSSYSPLETPQPSAVSAAPSSLQVSALPALRTTPSWLVAGLLLASAGCTVDVGPCDPFAAREIVYLNTGIAGDPNNGTPMFAGQALMQVTCGDGQFCHSNAATGGERYGVPTGLDFDFSVPCDASGCLPGAVSRLRANQSVAFDYRHHILQELQRGSMPPGRLGSDIRDEAGTYVRVDTADPFFVGGVDEGEPLPEAGTSEGRRIVANWLSCGLPVVERYEIPNTPQDSGRNCRGSTDCVYRVDALADPPEPNWPSIYETLIQPFCADSCHGPGEPDFREESQLDLSNIELAYDQMINRAAAGEDCGEDAGILIVPGNADGSLLIDKMENNSPSCGDPMPSGGRLFPPEFMAVIRQWIDEGAAEN